MLHMYPIHSTAQKENFPHFRKHDNNSSVTHMVILAMSFVLSFLAFLVSIIVLCK